MFALADSQTQKNYLKLLSNVASASRLFSTSSKPYLDYRMAENIFCMTFGAENVSRSCVAIDAKIGTLGIGIKTFVDASLQKIAEFDNNIGEFNGDPEHDVTVVSRLRNLRLKATCDSYGVNRLIYHYIVRSEGTIRIYEEPMELIDVDKIKIIKSSLASIKFTDRRSEYTFNRSKSTLLKNFSLDNPLSEFRVVFLEDPISELFGEMNAVQSELLPVDADNACRSLILPLFSMKGGRHVPSKSGLNLWNASGRVRHPNEVEIRIPAPVKRENEGFFPPRHVPFRLLLPDGHVLSASICQADDKAIMSNPNKDLGNWLLRTVLHLAEGEIATIEKLDELGVDAVIITRYSDYYRMDFTYIGEESKDAE